MTLPAHLAGSQEEVDAWHRMMDDRSAYELYVVQMTSSIHAMNLEAERLATNYRNSQRAWYDISRKVDQIDSPTHSELLPGSPYIPSSTQPVHLSPARPQEGGVPTHHKHCTKGRGNGWACDCLVGWAEGVPV